MYANISMLTKRMVVDCVVSYWSVGKVEGGTWLFYLCDCDACVEINSRVVHTHTNELHLLFFKMYNFVVCFSLHIS